MLQVPELFFFKLVQALGRGKYLIRGEFILLTYSLFLHFYGLYCTGVIQVAQIHPEELQEKKGPLQYKDAVLHV